MSRVMEGWSVRLISKWVRWPQTCSPLVVKRKLRQSLKLSINWSIYVPTFTLGRDRKDKIADTLVKISLPCKMDGCSHRVKVIITALPHLEKQVEVVYFFLKSSDDLPGEIFQALGFPSKTRGNLCGEGGLPAHLSGYSL